MTNACRRHQWAKAVDDGAVMVMCWTCGTEASQARENSLHDSGKYDELPWWHDLEASESRHLKAVR